jgi:hypothetical protein
MRLEVVRIIPPSTAATLLRDQKSPLFTDIFKHFHLESAVDK